MSRRPAVGDGNEITSTYVNSGEKNYSCYYNSVIINDEYHVNIMITFSLTAIVRLFAFYLYVWQYNSNKNRNFLFFPADFKQFCLECRKPHIYSFVCIDQSSSPLEFV